MSRTANGIRLLARRSRSFFTNRSPSRDRSLEASRNPLNQSASMGRDSTTKRASSSPPEVYSKQLLATRGRSRSRIRSKSLDGRTNDVQITEGGELEAQNQAYAKFRETPEDSKREWNKRMPAGHLVVYTDGSCKGSLSGFGIYMGPDHPLNRSQKILDPPHNSMRPEILAIIQALKNILEWDGYQDEPVIIRTDSLYVVQAINGIANQLGNYANEIQEILSLSEQIGGSVQFQHVYAHDGDPGNEAADLLAKQAVMGHEKRVMRRARSWSRNRSREYGRSRSRENNRDHIRTHSATIPGANSSA